MIPIKDTVPRKTFPVVTVAIIAVNSVVYFFELALRPEYLERLVYLFGLVPARYTHPEWAVVFGLPLDSYWPFFTSMFLHGGWLHVVSNMWILYLFGDNVEDRMGPLRFLVFYLIAGLAANMAHFLANVHSTQPVIGASGAVAGVMAAYLRLFPRARIVTLFPVFFIPYFVEIPAVFFMAIWFMTQLFSGAASLLAPEAAGGIAWWAHIGGFIVGFFLLRTLCGKSFRGCYRDEWYSSFYR